MNSPATGEVAHLPSILEYFRSVTTLAPFVAGLGIGWTAGVYFKKERIDVLEQAKDFLSRRVESMTKENEGLLAELRETRRRTDALTELLHEERQATARFMSEHSGKHAHCAICGGPVKKTEAGKTSHGYSYVILTCEKCRHEFRLSPDALASRI